MADRFGNGSLMYMKIILSVRYKAMGGAFDE